MTVVKPEEITQESFVLCVFFLLSSMPVHTAHLSILTDICCLNTALVMALRLKSHNHLDSVLQSLRQYEARNRVEVLSNFKLLLAFWIEYYQHRGRDKLSLELGSGLPFFRWTQLVEELMRQE